MRRWEIDIVSTSEPKRRKVGNRTTGDMVGEVYGKLTVEKFIKYDPGGYYWGCRCTCGAYRVLDTGQICRQGRPMDVDSEPEKLGYKYIPCPNCEGGTMLEDGTQVLSENIDRESLAEYPEIDGSGVYAIHLPTFGELHRLKLGWSKNLKDRLSQHRVLIPDLKVIRIWNGREQWMERHALLWAKNNGKQVSGEIFEFSDIESAIADLSAIFAKIGISSFIPEQTDEPGLSF